MQMSSPEGGNRNIRSEKLRKKVNFKVSGL